MAREPMYAWTIYDRPRDYPNCAVARRFLCELPDPAPTSDFIVGPTVEAVRAEVNKRYPGLVCFPRQPGDEPQIVETWL